MAAPVPVKDRMPPGRAISTKAGRKTLPLSPCGAPLHKVTRGGCGCGHLPLTFGIRQKTRTILVAHTATANNPKKDLNRLTACRRCGPHPPLASPACCLHAAYRRLPGPGDLRPELQAQGTL